MEFIEVSAKTVDDAITESLVKLGTTSDKIEYEVIEKGSSGFLGIGSRPAVIKVRKKSDVEDYVYDFLHNVFLAMEMEVEISISKSEDGKNVDVELKGEEMGVLIGKRGQTLDSLQYLTNLAVGKQVNEYVKVKIDTEDYRKRRRDTLENLAKNIAYKVKRTKRSVSLEPMNPFERRVIHSALQNDRYVNTHSEGEEPYRHVVVTLKRNNNNSNNNNSNNNSNNNNN
jgi:spoIIIJ-associated protein